MRLFIDKVGVYVGLCEAYDKEGAPYEVYIIPKGPTIGELKEVTNLTIEQYEALSARVTVAIEAACEGSRYLREERLAILARSK